MNSYREKKTGDSLFFISDVHLGRDDPRLETMKKENLFAFFEMVLEEGQGLFILGDLFEFWFEYNRAIPGKHSGVLSWLWRLRRRGIEIYYVVGNHDYWAGRFFEEELGVHVLKEPTVLRLRGKRTFITHGDGLGKGEIGYKIMKRVLRNRVTIFLFGLLHPRLGFFLARLTSAATQGDYEQKAVKASAALRAYALDRLKTDNIDLFITGHTHTPELTESTGRCFLNTGDWIRHFTYAEMKNGEIRLMRWGGRVEKIAAMAVRSRKDALE